MKRWSLDSQVLVAGTVFIFFLLPQFTYYYSITQHYLNGVFPPPTLFSFESTICVLLERLSRRIINAIGRRSRLDLNYLTHFVSSSSLSAFALISFFAPCLRRPLFFCLFHYTRKVIVPGRTLCFDLLLCHHV